MEKFLEKIADRLIEQHGADFSNVIVVLPARRARLFLLKYLNEKLQRAFWTPQCLVMPEFVELLASAKIASRHALVLALYDCYRNVHSSPESFDTFSKWSSVALKDFNDIDVSLANAGQVFSDLREIREIENWSFNSTQLSAAQESYLRFWNELGELYDAFTAYQLRENTWTYGGMLRSLLTTLRVADGEVKGKHIYLAGIAAYSSAESALLKELNEIASVEIFWDVDAYYVDDAMHEAGFFARKGRLVWGRLDWLGQDIVSGRKNIHIYEATTAIGQVYGAASLLKKMQAEELNEACVVLADETLLEPLIASLGELPVPVNLSLGIPLRNSSLSKWISALFNIKTKAREHGIYHKGFLEWIELSRSLGLPDAVCESIRKHILGEVWIYLAESNMHELSETHEPVRPFLDLLRDQPDTLLFLQKLKGTISRSVIDDTNDEWILLARHKVSGVMDELELLLRKHKFLSDFGALSSLWNMLVSQERITFEGEPVDGLQVLGMVETRALDFRNIIFIGANEDTLPGNAPAQSFIPFDVRSLYGLPLPDEREAMFAYTFYRVLQRSENVDLFYSSISSDFRGTEQSRFITQLESELPAVNPGANITRVKMKLNEGTSSGNEQFILNDDFARKRMDELFSNGLSPSAINKFNTCPLDFYYRYIMGLGEEDVLEEQMSSATFGSVVHHVLENFYLRFKGSYPSVKDYDELKNSLDLYLAAAFEREYSKSSMKYGFNYLAGAVAKDMLLRIINFETGLLKKRNTEGIQPVLIDVEFPLQRDIDVSKYDWNRPIRLRGKGDRIENVAGKTLILDYKTGKVEEKDVNFNSSIESLVSENRSGKQLQLLAYIYMFTSAGSSPENIRAGFYSFMSHSKGFMFLGGDDDTVTQAMLDDFERAMVEWVKSMYSLEKFQHNPDSRHCEYCR